HAFNALRLPRLVAVTYPENLASQRVLNKLGFTRHEDDVDYKGVRAAYYVLARDARAGRGGNAVRGIRENSGGGPALRTPQRRDLLRRPSRDRRPRGTHRIQVRRPLHHLLAARRLGGPLRRRAGCARR